MFTCVVNAQSLHDARVQCTVCNHLCNYKLDKCIECRNSWDRTFVHSCKNCLIFNCLSIQTGAPQIPIIRNKLRTLVSICSIKEHPINCRFNYKRVSSYKVRLTSTSDSIATVRTQQWIAKHLLRIDFHRNQEFSN